MALGCVFFFGTNFPALDRLDLYSYLSHTFFVTILDEILDEI